MYDHAHLTHTSNLVMQLHQHGPTLGGFTVWNGYSELTNSP